MKDPLIHIWCAVPLAEDHVAQAMGVRLGALKRLEKWEMGSEIARAPVKTFPETTMLWVMGAYHIRRHEDVETALEFFSGGQAYLSGDGLFWYWLSCYQCQCRLLGDAKKSLAKALVFDPYFRDLAVDEDDLDPPR